MVGSSRFDREPTTQFSALTHYLRLHGQAFTQQESLSVPPFNVAWREILAAVRQLST